MFSFFVVFFCYSLWNVETLQNRIYRIFSCVCIVVCLRLIVLPYDFCLKTTPPEIVQRRCHFLVGAFFWLIYMKLQEASWMEFFSGEIESSFFKYLNSVNLPEFETGLQPHIFFMSVAICVPKVWHSYIFHF